MHQSAARARPPQAAAPLIPLSAAGRAPLFLYGTLMDRDVLAHVLGRAVAAADLAPARLPGFARRAVPGVGYPVLVAEPPAVVAGVLLRRATRRDIVRLNHYESGEYRAERHPVEVDGEAAQAAWLYLGLDHLRPAAASWSLPRWQAEHKAGFFARCAGWMADCPDAA